MRIATLFFCASLLLINMSCKQSKTDESSPQQGEVIVKLDDDVTGEQLESSFTEYQLKVVKRLGAKSSYYLCKFDIRSVETDSMVSLLKNSDMVVEAQRNRDLSTRKN